MFNFLKLVFFKDLCLWREERGTFDAPMGINVLLLREKISYCIVGNKNSNTNQNKHLTVSLQ